MSAAARFGPYELVQRLGAGGMAETYLAVRRGPGGFEQHVCVKRILPAFEADPEFVRQFMDEARLAAQLRHGNITQVVDFGVVEGSHYLALELVDGMDLRSFLARMRERGQAIDASLAVLVGMELAAALEAAHAPGRGRLPVIHRDISPSNVLLSRAGEVYLTDFGIARALGVKRRTDSGVVRGKVPYMAAEYALHGHFDARTDLFSVGVVLYEMLAGRRPYEGATDLDTLQRIKAGAHVPLAHAVPAIPPLVADIVERLLQPEPTERFQSAGALHEALAHVAPPANIARHLGELVRSLGESLSKSFSKPLDASVARTAGLGAPKPAYPAVRPAPGDAPTRTSDAPDIGFDQTQYASHDSAPPTADHARQAASAAPAAFVAGTPSYDTPAPRPAAAAREEARPLAQTRPLHASAPAIERTPPAHGPGVWALIALLVIAAFGAALAAAYFLVEYLRATGTA